MSGPGVVLTVLAVVLGGGAGGPEGGYPIDKGLLDGLVPGDRGAVHYVLTVGSEERSIPAGEAVVVTVEPSRAWVEVAAERPPRPGYRVVFELPANRLAPRHLLRAVSEHLEGAEREAATREVVEEWVLGEDEAVRETLLEELARATGASSETPPEPRPSEAIEEISTPQPTSSPRSLDSARDEPGTEPASLGAAVAAGAEAPPGMLLVPAGTYSIGAPRDAAAFYNQQPRFDVFLEAFWIDAAPVRIGRVGEGRTTSEPASQQEGGTSQQVGGTSSERASQQVGGTSEQVGGTSEQVGGTSRREGSGQWERAPVETGGTWLTGVSFGEAKAFCRRLGKRLPTELEWEVAVTSAGGGAVGGGEDLSLRAPVLEWTASWYQPYPGNPVSESEYGERYRVLRGAGTDEALSPRRRRFMAPDARHPGVGFRCVLDG